ncbi:hypothetical protein V2J09_017736 [Rumex salicifolius]
MGSRDSMVEIESLQKVLLSGNGLAEEVPGGASTGAADGDENEAVLYTASFREMEERFVKYQTAQWIMYSLLFILAWGIGIFMILYLPVRRYILRKDILSRKLYVTHNSIVYKVTKPVSFPCFGVLKKEKHVLLPSVADVVIEQGYLQSLFGIYSVRIENAGVRRPPSDDVQIQGVADPVSFRKAVLGRIANMRSDAFSRQISAIEDASILKSSHPQAALASASSKSLRYEALSQPAELILQKLEDLGNSVKILLAFLL